MRTDGFLIVLSGFAGAGKGTIVKKLLERYPEQYALSVSATTRAPRPGEKEGREYFFKTQEEFDAMIKRGEFLEYARYVGHSYGTPASYVREQMALGKNVILEIEIQGALQVREKFPDTLLLFVVPPSARVLLDRLHHRGSETEDEIRGRLQRAVEEAEGSEAYDYLLVNDDLASCVERAHQIMQNERCRMKYCLGEIDTMKEDIAKYARGKEL